MRAALLSNRSVVLIICIERYSSLRLREEFKVATKDRHRASAVVSAMHPTVPYSANAAVSPE